MNYLIGIDVGTSATKTVLFDENGQIKGSVSCEYPLYQPENGWAEQKAEDWRDAVLKTLKEVMKLSGVPAEEVKGIGISGQMHGLVMLCLLYTSDVYKRQPYVLTFVVFILCCIMTNFMSNTATTALMAPICLSIAEGMGADPRAVLMACVIGGSCAYATPIGMPANTMVVGAGGYTFMDYVKAGLPLIVIATIVSMIILPIAFPFFP